ncbi:MAG: helix-turn-helix transcriptional regulator [Eubacterium sp.]|nr:helix-turn-helix transcriptional regulator [Eubacterium sp.]
MNFEGTDIGKIVRTLRKSKGMSRLVLSNAVGISESHLKKIETGVRQPGIDTYKKILETLEAEIVIVDKDKTVKGSCVAKIQDILQNSTEEQAVFMAAVVECMAQNMERVGKMHFSL